MTFIIPTWCGLPAEGEARADPFLRLGTLVAGGLATAPYGTALSLQAPFLVYGRRIFMETCWLPGLDSGSIPALMAPMAAAVSPGCAIATHEFKGAASRVPAEATAFGLRREHVLVEIVAVCADPAEKAAEERHRQWTRATREALHETALPGGYIRTFSLLTMRNVWPKAMAPMPNGCWPPSGATIPITCSPPPFRCPPVGNRKTSSDEAMRLYIGGQPGLTQSTGCWAPGALSRAPKSSAPAQQRTYRRSLPCRTEGATR
jgi:hypothetical protein